MEGFGGSFADWTVAAVLGAQGGSAGANALAGHFAAGCAESCSGYVDEDGDGVCDWRGAAASGAGSRGACPGYADADGGGVCDACGNAVGACPGYVDEDGDGVCDRYGQGACGGNAGCGRGVGCGHGWRR